MSDLFLPRKDAIIEIWSGENIPCSCGVIPKRIYCTWLYDSKFKHYYLKFFCYECCKKIFKSPGYFREYIEVLRQRFNGLHDELGLLFIADNFYCIDLEIIEQNVI
jgi:hypothetical protein